MKAIFTLIMITCGVCLRLPAQIALTVAKPNASDVALNWTGGASPYSVTRSSRPDFAAGVSLLAQSTTALTYTYIGAQGNGLASEFFSVGDTANPPAGTGNGMPDPPLQPVITSLSTIFGTDNETVTITGTGFSTNAVENIVFFDGKPAAAITAAFTGFAAASATTITVKVPVGATSGNVRGFVNGLLTNPVPFTVIVNDPATPFVWFHIRSMAYDPPTRGLLVSDGVGANKIYALQWNTGTMKWDRPQIDVQTNAVLSHRDAAGYFYMGRNATLNISRTTFTGPSAVFDTKCPSATATAGGIRAVGARETETDTAYCSYVVTNPATGFPNHVARKVLSGTQDFDYGNFGATSLTFPVYGSIVFDKAGNAFVTETTQIRKITPAEVTSVIQTGFTSLASLDWIGKDAADPGYLVAVDRSTSKLFIIDLSQSPVAMTEIKPAIPFNVPVSAVFGLDPELQTSVLYVAEDPASPATAKRIARYRDPRVDPINDNALLKMLLSKQVAFDSYDEPAFQNSDGLINPPFKIEPKPLTGTTVYARVIDPADTVGYPHLSAQPGCTVDTPLGNKCDNGGQTYGFGSGASLLKTASATMDANGVATFTLKMSPDADTTTRFSGDNYRVQVSFDNFATAPAPLVVGVSPLIVAYKRLYVQRSAMYQQGGMLKTDYPHSGCTLDQIVLDITNENLVSNYCPSFPCTPAGLQLALFDKDNPANNPLQIGTVLSIAKPTLVGACGKDQVLVTLTAPLTIGLSFKAGVSAGGKSAGAGIVNAGTFPMSFPEKLPFEDASTEIIIPIGARDLQTPFANAAFFGTCSAPTPNAANWSDIWSPRSPNHIHVAFIDSRGAGSLACTAAAPPLFNTIQLTDLYNDLRISDGSCTAPSSCPNLAAYEQFAMDHEPGHQFVTNGCTSGSHDLRCDWLTSGACTDPLTYCLMNVNGSGIQRSQSRRRFDFQDLLLGDPNCPVNQQPSTSIRRRADPLQ